MKMWKAPLNPLANDYIAADNEDTKANRRTNSQLAIIPIINDDFRSQYRSNESR